jgi:hypothetical protein
MIIVLPSEFTGGDAHVSHGEETKVFDTSALSLSKTTVLAWYTDVMHEIVGDFRRSSDTATLTATAETDHKWLSSRLIVQSTAYDDIHPSRSGRGQ